jgi:ubiquinol-cytochrome c reductase cytochrome c subunit
MDDRRRPDTRELARGATARRRSLAGLIALVGIGVAAAVNAGLSLGAPLTAAGPARTTTAAAGTDAAAGRDLYLVSCAACHGDQAQGTVNGPSITQAGPALLDFMMRTGRMPLPEPKAPLVRGQPLLTPAEIAEVVAYVSSLGGGGPEIPNVATSGADLALGRRLFTANCAACHGAGGAGGAVGNGIIAPGLGRSTPLDIGEAVVGGPPPMPNFLFAQDELNAIAAYVGYLQHPANPGGISLSGLGPVPEGFIAGFVGLVALLVVARWIGASPRRGVETAVPKPDDAPSDGAA